MAYPTELIDGLLAREPVRPAALEYLRRLNHLVVVVKYGGAAMVAAETAAAFAHDVGLLRQAGLWPVVVHGGGPALTQTMDRLGIESTFVGGHRVTDAETAEVAEMVLSGRVNKQVVSLLQRSGCRAVGLSGTDGGLVRVERHRPNGTDIGFVGRVATVDAELLQLLCENDYVPVVSSTAADDDGQPHNINADVMAGAVAAQMSADLLLFLSDTPGLLVGGRTSPRLSVSRAASLLDEGVATGGMRPKLEAALAALSAGVSQVRLVDGRRRHAVLRGIMAEEGFGTLLVAGDTPS